MFDLIFAALAGEGLDVKSRHLVERVEPEALRLACPDLADVLVGGEAAQGLIDPALIVLNERQATPPRLA